MSEPRGAASYRDFAMPAPLVAGARAWLEGPRHPAPPARPSATVMLLRDGPSGLEVFTLRRSATMRFAPHVLAFPGGGVDPRDADPHVPWAGPSPGRWAALLREPEDRARELVIAAAREVFEECGVLLAGPDGGSVVDDVAGPDWHAERAALLAREQSFGELLIRRGLVLRSDLLRLRAHWITPECEPRRYDTRFFAALLPRGQAADDRSTEAAGVAWVRPGEALEALAAGREAMLPPTEVMLEQLAGVGSAAEALGLSPVVWPVQPWPAEHDGRVWMRAPVGPDGHGAPLEREG